MYSEFFGLRERPFSLLPDPAYLYFSQGHEMALTMLNYSIASRLGISVITGEIGSGKTTLMRRLLSDLQGGVTVGVISNTHAGMSNLLEWVLNAFDLNGLGKSQAEQFAVFNQYLQEQSAAGNAVILIVDEAQNLSRAMLEELRVLSNINMDKTQYLQLIVIGQPELRQVLDRPDMLQFIQRVSIDYHLDRLGPRDIPLYIDHRVEVAGGSADLFSAEAKQYISRFSTGIPRIINTLCDTALVYAYADGGHQVDGEIMKQVLCDRLRKSLLPIADSARLANGQQPA